MKYYIIGDLHNHVDWVDSWLESKQYDFVIFLGDYFDNFGDNASIAENTAIWLKSSISDPKRIHLMGNHDMPYRFPNNSYYDCPGYTLKKKQAINSVLGFDDWSKIKMAHFIHDENVIFSHAGLTEKLFPCCPVNGFNSIKIESEIQSLITNEPHSKTKYNPWFCYNIDGSYDGLTWIRPNNFNHLPKYTQFVGHTPVASGYFGKNPNEVPIIRHNNSLESKLIICDCVKSWVGVYDNKQIYFEGRNSWDGKTLVLSDDNRLIMV